MGCISVQVPPLVKRVVKCSCRPQWTSQCIISCMNVKNRKLILSSCVRRNEFKTGRKENVTVVTIHK